MVEVLRREARDHAFGVAVASDMAAFNALSNSTGGQLRVFVLDTSEMSEGVSFMAVRRFLFACVPRSLHAFVQRAGRAVRIGSHKELPANKRTVNFELFIAVTAGRKSEDQHALAELVRSASTMVGALDQFRAQSISASTDGGHPASAASSQGHGRFLQPTLPAEVSHAVTLKGWELCEVGRVEGY